jgi:predicted ribosome quality control (RQC) complex YloA/Tae2 family protein
MDNLVLIRVAATLGASLCGSVLRECREESLQRYRLVFEGAERPSSVLISLDPVLPWIGRPCTPWDGPRRAPGSFAARIQKSAAGLRVREIRKAGADRVVLLELSDGQTLVAELATHGANLIHVDSGGNVIGSARHPRKAQDRIAHGRAYRLPTIPEGRLNPFGMPADLLDDRLRALTLEGEDLLEALRRRAFGIGTAAAELVLEESRFTGRKPGQVLADRLSRLEAGETDPVVAGVADPLAQASRGTLDPSRLQLLPWEPRWREPRGEWIRGMDAAATAGIYHESLEKARRVAARIDALAGILESEIRRLWDAERRIVGDLENLGDPKKFRRFGEALLAGLGRARRTGDLAWVPDPYDAEEVEIAVPARADRTLTQVAEEHFERSRKARRGLVAAQARREAMSLRVARLERVREGADGARGEEAAERIEAALRDAGIPVALRSATRAGRAEARTERPRLEGVRLLTSSDGLAILVGKTGRDNDRLTFKLAAAEDFWFHAAGVPGAHVVVRNPTRQARPPSGTLEEAAKAAAWYSDAKGKGQADVQWTRRKYVRRVRGAPAGTVTLKRCETIRVRPTPPAGSDREPL